VNKQAEQILKKQKKCTKVRDEAKRAGRSLLKRQIPRTETDQRSRHQSLKKRLAEESAKKLKSEAVDQAKNLEEEANKQADQILLEARKKQIS